MSSSSLLKGKGTLEEAVAVGGAVDVVLEEGLLEATSQAMQN